MIDQFINRRCLIHLGSLSAATATAPARVGPAPRPRPPAGEGRTPGVHFAAQGGVTAAREQAEHVS